MTGMIKFAICDDEQFFAEKLYSRLTEILNTHNIYGYISVFNGAEDLLKSCKNYDIYLLDIEMKGVTGMKAAEQINSMSEKKPIIIFVTNYEAYVYNSFELEVFRFLPKDRLDTLFERYVISAIEKYKSLRPKYYVLKNRNEIINLMYNDINYVKKDGKNAVFYMKNGKYHKERISLKEVFDALNDERFVFADRGYIVNINNIVSINDTTVVMREGTKLDISRRRITDIKRSVTDYWGKRS